MLRWATTIWKGTKKLDV